MTRDILKAAESGHSIVMKREMLDIRMTEIETLMNEFTAAVSAGRSERAALLDTIGTAYRAELAVGMRNA